MEHVGSRALIVEGGAMRGVFSCGILDHFLAADFSPFDSFWGVSAGASNLAAYLAKMPGRNLKIYLDYSLRNEFITPSQLIRGGDVMDLDWMWQVTLEELGIDKEVLAADPRPFFLVVTRQDTGQAEYLTPDVDMLAETMKASSALPVLVMAYFLMALDMWMAALQMPCQLPRPSREERRKSWSCAAKSPVTGNQDQSSVPSQNVC